MESAAAAPCERINVEVNERGDELVRLMEVATLCTLPMALNGAIRLKVMDILASGDTGEPELEASNGRRFLSAAQIVSHSLFPALSRATTLHSASGNLDRILRLLAGHGILDSRRRQAQHDPLSNINNTFCNTYSLNLTSRFLVHSTSNHATLHGCLAPFVSLMQDPVFMHCLYDLDEGVLDTSIDPFTRKHGMECFPYSQFDARFNATFHCGMVAHTKLFIHALLDVYHGFQQLTSIVDVGGGSGVCAGVIASKFPHIKVINFDQPHVIANAPHYPGVEHAAGDMFEAIPEADAIFMKWIMHTWGDADCMRILKNCYQVLPWKGKVIIAEVILPPKVDDDIEARVGYQIDVLMLVTYKRGKERTKCEFEKIARASGFTDINYASQVHGITIIELYKSSNSGSIE